MANKRMFDKKVVCSDKFIDLPNSSKALYFMAGMEADDKGFFQPRKLQRMCGFSDDDYKILIAKGFFITFESGVMIVTDWNKNNWLDSRRITETEYIDELKLLKLVNQKYEFKPEKEDAKQMLSEYSIVENSIDKNSIESYSIKNNFHQKIQCDAITKNKKERCMRESSFNINGKNYCNQHARELIPDIEIANDRFKKPTLQEVQEYCQERNNNIDPEQFINFYESKNWMIGKNKMKNWKACIVTWEKRSNQGIQQKEIPEWFGKELDIKEDKDNEIEKILKEIGE